MTAKIINGRDLAKTIRQNLARDIQEISSPPGLAVVLVGDNPASHTYVNMKKRACEEVGMRSFSHELPEDCSEQELLTLVQTLNKQVSVHGILVQLPLPKQIDACKVIDTIAPEKDVDGFHPMTPYVSCTPGGIMQLIDQTGIAIKGKKAVIVGRSNIVGRPTAKLLLERDATITICHRHTNDLRAETIQADILVVAVGKAHLITADMVQPGAVVIDVGMNRVDGKLTGDVDFEGVKEVASYITPVPGGVGPMTIAVLLQNTLEAARK
jgi:methylenetetrahydrofolate dehydrogenase (NADP+)/methenyltetrahydrofolate cyclohydrolase